MRVYVEETYYFCMIPFSGVIRNRSRVTLNKFELGAKMAQIIPGPLNKIEAK